MSAALSIVGDHDEALDQDAAADSKRLEEVFDRAMRRFELAVYPQLEMRSLALAARRFVTIPGAQWEGDFGDAFDNAIKLEINLTQTGLEKIYRDYNDNRIVPEFRPSGDKGDADSAETLAGLHRADSYRFKAQQARDNAFMEGTAGGFGAYRLTNEWADPYDKDSDAQCINPGLAIVDADQRVFFDPDSTLYDKCDAKYAFVITAKSREEFEAENDESLTDFPEDMRLAPVYDWFRPDVVKVAEYYEVEDVDEKLLILTHALSGEEDRYWQSELDSDELADMKKMGWTVSTRSAQRKRVHKYVLSGAEVLGDQGLIAGDRIPIVPYYGKRSYIDGVERFSGYVQERMDRQRLYNSSVSRLAETNAQSPREIPIFAAEQMPQNLADLWSRQVLERHAYALVKPLINPSTGELIAAGPIGKVEPPQLPPVTAALLQLARTDLVEDQQDGADEVKANTSADALDVAATRVDAKSGIFLDNFRQTVQCEGEIWLSMNADLRVEPGQVVDTMDENGNQDQATLVQQYTGRNGTTGYKNDFTRGYYNVVANVTEATATRRDKATRACLNLAEVAVQAQNMPLANVSLLTAVMNQDGEGTANMQKWARKQLIQLGVEEPTDEEKAELEQAAQQQQQQPDPEAIVAAAKAQDLTASAQQREADARLKLAQADAVGGPDAAPAVPDGLEAVHKAAQIGKTIAETHQLQTETAHAPQKLAIEATNAGTNRIKATGDRFAKLKQLFTGGGK